MSYVTKNVTKNVTKDVTQDNGWEAKLDLVMEQRATRTVLARRQHVGPLVVQKPFYPEGPVCHIYIIHPPGGVVGGDKLSVAVTGLRQSQTLITTPAANKFYRSGGALAHLSQQLTLDENTALEWLPQETILFNGSAVHSETRIDVGEHSCFIGWEITCLGRPASGEKFTDGVFRQQIELWKQSQPLFIERAMLQGGHPILEAPWGLQSFTVTATMLVYPAHKGLLSAAREAIGPCTDALCSATLMNEVLVGRYLGHHAEQAKAVFTSMWSAVRLPLLHREACAPRIWNT